MLILPKEYEPKLNLIDTQKAIKLLKDVFEKTLAEELNLIRVSAPLYVSKKSGLNDHLNGYERPVVFDIKDLDQVVEVVQSLAKWKRSALKKYGFNTYEGLYTDMNAIRRDEILDNLHSSYVDQWDFELIINDDNRNMEYLKAMVTKIVKALKNSEDLILNIYPNLNRIFDKEIHFISTEELLNKYPNLNSKEREDAICKEYGLVFISQIGDKLSNNEKHDGRAFDYDDWSLNGDLMVWYPTLNRAVELSSMGIRVNKEALLAQAVKANVIEDSFKTYHKDVLNNKLPLTFGGGIGQSRLSMVMLDKAHIGEVQASLWSKSMVKECAANKIYLL